MRAAYGEEVVYERHRHRYEVNNHYRRRLEEAGLVCSGTSPDDRLVEFIELPPSHAPVLRGHPGAPRVQEPARPAAPAVRRVRAGRAAPGPRAACRAFRSSPSRSTSRDAPFLSRPVSGFTVLGSEVVARAGFLAITEEELQGPDGDRFTRVVVRHPGAVVVVPIDGDGALLVRQFRAALGTELLEVPAGKRDVDGEPPEETARRELEEEIGHRPGRLVKLAEFYNTPGFSDEYTHLFAALDLEDLGVTRRVGPEEQAMTMERVPLAAVDDLIARARSATPRASSACCWRAGSSMPERDELARLLDEHDTWLAVERGLAANSLSAYRRDLRRYASYLRSQGLTDAALVDESTVAAYVDQLKAARDDDGQPRYAPSSIARALVAVRSFHRFCLDEGLVDGDPERGGRRATRAAGDPEGADRGRGRGACSARSSATVPGRCATGRSSRRSTRPACGSASSSGSTGATSTSTAHCCACSARATRSGSSRSGGPRAPRSRTTSPGADPSWSGRVTRTRVAGDPVLLERAWWPADPPGLLEDRDDRR